MSKQLSAQIPCPYCKHQFTATVYRSIWIEYPENRKLVFEDKINVVTCPSCKTNTKIPISLLVTNVKEHIAVWYEPYPDPDVEKDVQLYAKHFGAHSFYATAPRVRDWNAFKEKIVELEQRTGMKPDAVMSPEMHEKMRGFLESLKGQSAKKNVSPLKRIWIPQAVVSFMLLWALNPDNPYGYYILLRWICCAVFAYLAVQAIINNKHQWAWVLGITAAIYNPFFRVHLTRDLWSVINVFTIGIAITSVIALKVKKGASA